MRQNQLNICWRFVFDGEKKYRRRMAGNAEPFSQDPQSNDCSFQWDEASQLYFHASTGFYHDPDAGWYYSSRDGLYYKFENGNYVRLESQKGDESGYYESELTTPSSAHEDMNVCSSNHVKVESESKQSGGTASNEPNSLGPTECITSEGDQNPPPPSEWVEETLINLYLSGYSDPAVPALDNMMVPAEIDNRENFLLLPDEHIYELEEGEWIPEDCHGASNTNACIPDEGISFDEENWLAQYGQVNQPEESMAAVPVVELWDWTLVTENKKDKKGQVARLIGRLVRQSTKLHPSLPFGRSFYKTAPISEVYLDLVRVATGKVYKLRTPSTKYLASLSLYDSSNPTKEWGFPELFIGKQVACQSNNSELKTTEELQDQKDPLTAVDQVFLSQKHKPEYRDRAAERRALHGGFGVGPGQKNSKGKDLSTPSSPASDSAHETTAEALNMSFGAGSYARKILESMGWKEGEALGSTQKGLLEPLQPVGNKGSAGLGWTHGGREHY